MGVDFVSVQIIIVKTHGGFFHFSLPLGLEMWDATTVYIWYDLQQQACIM